MNDLNREEDDDPSNIRNYLASFHKEIDAGDMEETDSFIEQDSEDECGNAKVIYRYFSDNELDEDDQNIIHIKAEPDDDDDDETDFYTSLNFHGDKEPNFLKAKVLSNIGTVLRTDSKGELIEDLNDDLSNGAIEDSADIEEKLNIDDPRTLQMVAKFAEQAVAKAKNSDPDADNSYQTVTIVPSDTNPGELSYVLFVSKDNNLNQVVYDLHDPAQLSSALLTKGIERNRGKVRALRLGHPQLVTPEHMCPYCSYRSSKKYLLSRHLKSHSDDRPHKCGVCERGFKTVASLQNHVNTHTGTRPHPCKECDSCFTTSGELVRHVRYKHTHERPHKCTECDYASVELSKLKRHLRCHTGERPYQCPHCTYASPDTYKLKRHLRIHTGEKPYECDICQTRFTQSNSLKAHKLIHSRNKPIFRCEYCPTTCGRKTDLRIHMEKLHSSDNPHRCKRCSKVFLDRYSYKIHVKSHDGEKCYKCDLCSYASTSHRHLETHMLVHTDEKPFVCDACDMSFRQKQLLKRHKNLYHDPNYVRPEPKEKTHVCDVCFKAFRHKGNLLRHLVVHDPDASMSDHEAALSLGASTEAEGLRYEDEKDDQKSQEVVVFEVIQLPPSRGSAPQPTLAVVDGNSLSVDGESQLFSIIEPADEEEDDFQFPTDTVTAAKSISKNTKETSLKNCVVHAQKSKKVAHSKKLPRLLKVSAAKDAPSPEKLLLPEEKELTQTEFENAVESFSFTEREEDLLISTSDYQEFAENLDGLS